jgi:hypothetical protein
VPSERRNTNREFPIYPTPKDQPHVLVLAMSDKSTPEVSFRVEAGHLTDSVRYGAEVIFEGVPTAFSK